MCGSSYPRPPLIGDNRSVHNIRIERLWVDITRGFGRKWKDFFQILEVRDGLDVNLDSHIWLLHYLFLEAINRDAEMWTGTWNNHTLSRRGEPHRSPHNMYMYGMIENGVRGIQVEEQEGNSDEDFAGYGIDWDDINNPHTMQHHLANNNDNEADATIVFTPQQLSHVEVPDPRCPFTTDQIEFLDRQLSAMPIFSLHDMHSRRLLWIEALILVTNMLHG